MAGRPVRVPGGGSPGSHSATGYNDAVGRWRKDLNLDDSFEIALRTGGDILGRLVRPEFAGVRAFWWDEHVLDLEWCEERVDWAQAASSSRYDPSLGVSVPLDSALDAFRSGRAWDETEWRSWLRLRADAATLASTTRGLPGGLVTALGALADAPDDREVLLQSRGAVREAVRLPPETAGLVAALDDGAARSAAERAGETLLEAGRLLSARLASMAASRSLLVHGEGGAGKSHALFAMARRCLSGRQPVVFLLGSRYEDGDLWSGITGQLGLPPMSSDELLGMMQAASDAYGQPLVLVIDALNESRRPQFWERELPVVRWATRSYPGIRVCVSIKDVYLGSLDPEERLGDAWTLVRHWGFRADLATAVAAYFRHYGIRAPEGYTPGPELANPLFLKLYCQGLADAGLNEPPVEDEDLWKVYERYLQGRDRVICRALRVLPARRPVERAVSAIADSMAASGSNWVPREKADELVTAVLPEHAEWPDGLFGQLLGENLLVDDVLPGRAAPNAAVRFSYNGLSDYLIARSIVGRATAEGRVDAARLVAQLRWADVGLTSSLASMLAQTKGVELAAIGGIDQESDRVLLRAVVDALPTLARSIAGPATWGLVRAALGGEFRSPAFDALLLTAAEGSSDAARTLHEALIELPMPERDAIWSVYAIGGPWEQPVGVAAVLEAARTVVEAGDEGDVAERLSLLLPWLLSSPDNNVRLTAGRLLAAMWSRSLGPARTAIAEFAGVDDPNVTSGVLTAAYGAVLRGGLARVEEALALVREVRAAAEQRQFVDDLARDAVDGLVEWGARARGRSPDATSAVEEDISIGRMVWISELPAEPPSDAALAERYGEAFHSIRYSLHAMGDFGNYVLEPRLRRFRPSSRTPATVDWTDRDVAARWILARVVALGWTPERFAETDRTIPSHDGRSSRRVERIGKKYQWIALRELMARLADHLDPDSDEGVPRPYDYFGRDYDPSFGPLGGARREDLAIESWWTTGVTPEGEGSDTEWTSSEPRFGTIENEVRAFDGDSGAWVALSRYSSCSLLTKESEEREEARGGLGSPHRNEWHLLWAWLVPARDADRLARYLEGRTLWGRWMREEPQHIDGPYLGELPWASSAARDEVWASPFDARDWPRGLEVALASESYTWELGVRDHTLAESSRAMLPSRVLYDAGSLDWVGGETAWEAGGLVVARYLDASKRDRDEERTLLVREAWLRPLLARLGLAIVWGSLRGRQVLGGSMDDVRNSPEASIDGRAVLGENWSFAPSVLRIRRPGRTRLTRARRPARGGTR